MTTAQSKKRVKVLFVIDKWQTGGRQRVLQQIINALDPNVFDSVLLILSKPSSSFPLPNSRVLTLPSMRYRSYILPVARIIRSEQPQIVSSHLGVLAAPVVWISFLVSRTKTAVIYTVQSVFDLDSYKRTRFPRINKYLISFSLKAAAAVTTASEGMIVPLSKEFGLEQSYMQRAPHLVYSSAEYSGVRDQTSTHGPIRILSVGRLAYPKDFSTLLQAFKKAQGSLPSIPMTLSIIGGGPEEERLRRETRDLGLDESIFKGISTVDKATLDTADIFLFSSCSEGMPVVLIEALAAGVPVIATDCDFGPRELIRNGSNGFLVPVGDADTMAGAIVRLSSDPELRRAFSQAGPPSVKIFELTNAIKEWQKIFLAQAA